MAENRLIKDCFFRYFKFLFERIFYEIYNNNNILYQLNQQKISEIKIFTINIDLDNSSHKNLLCVKCLNTCFINYNGNSKCLLCTNNCKHFISNQEYKKILNNISMTIKNFLIQFNSKRSDEVENEIYKRNNYYRSVIFNKFNEIKTNIESNMIQFKYPFDKLIMDIKNSISKEDLYYNYKIEEINKLNKNKTNKNI